MEPPLLTITRVATRDTELGGVKIPAGATVMPMLGSANRQEERYPDPDKFDIFRQAKANLGWGYGVHVCLGMHLARLEMRTAINLLLDRLPNLRMDPDGDDPHIRGQVFRSPTSLPVLFDPHGRTGAVCARSFTPRVTRSVDSVSTNLLLFCDSRASVPIREAM